MSKWQGMNNAMRWGARAFLAGQDLNNNPFPLTTVHSIDWDAGWLGQQRYAQSERTAEKVMLAARLDAMYQIPEESV